MLYTLRVSAAYLAKVRSSCQSECVCRRIDAEPYGILFPEKGQKKQPRKDIAGSPGLFIVHYSAACFTVNVPEI